MSVDQEAPEAIEHLNQRGDALRERMNNLFVRTGAALQFTGLGSVMTLHAVAQPISNPADLKNSEPRVKELLFFDLIERGVYIARRGLVALSLPFGDAQARQFAAAMEDIIEKRRSLLPRRGQRAAYSLDETR